MNKVNKITAKTTAEELFQELPAVKVATHAHAESEHSRRKDSIEDEAYNGQKFYEALRAVYGKKGAEYKHRVKPLYLSNNVKGIIRGEWVERYKKISDATVKPETIGTYAGNVMSYLEANYPIAFTPTGEALTQAAKDKLEAKAIKSRAVTATKKTASSVASNITSMIGDIRDLANELVNRKGDKVRSPSAKKALTQLDRIEKTVSKKLETLLK
jgi:hypothetical protein